LPLHFSIWVYRKKLIFVSSSTITTDFDFKVNFSFAVDLDIQLEILDKTSNAISQPASIQYYWRSGDASLRSLNVMLNFEINQQQLSPNIAIPQPASVRFT
jgi:hypothetical protein